jgi:hypothetical protein
VSVPVLSKQTELTTPAKLILLGLKQNIRFFLNRFNAKLNPIYNVVGNVGGTHTANRSSISVIRSVGSMNGYLIK